MKYYLLVFLLFLVTVHVSQEIKDRNNFKLLNNNIERKKSCSENCLSCEDSICKKCEKGFYSLKNACYENCPVGFYADNFSLSCKIPEENPVYIKAYTLSRCTNKCGVKFNDCSCENNCKLTGTCCSDYKYCDLVNQKNITSTNCDIENCNSCTNDKENSLCLMCNEGFFYYKNKCYKDCPKNTNVIDSNNICLDKSPCLIDNCETCDISNTKCTKCVHGFFLHENECSRNCPAGTRADRIHFVCENKTSFAFNVIFPSKGSCYNKCGIQNKNIDCSCNVDCLSKSNCCDDFEKECESEYKKEKCKSCLDCFEGKCKRCKDNSEMYNGDCICKIGFHFDKDSDECKIGFAKKKNEKRISDYNNSFEDSNKYKINQNGNSYQKTLSNMLLSLFHNIQNDKDNKFGLIPTMSDIEVNGNITMNIFEGNTNPNIVNERFVNENSFNNSTIFEKNINSHNSYIGNKFKEPEIHLKEKDNQNYNKNFKESDKSENKYNVIENKKNSVEDIASKVLKGSLNPLGTLADFAAGEIFDLRKLNNLNKKDEFNNEKTKNKNFRKIEIKKHNHVEHEKKFPSDLEHDEDKELEIPKPNIKQKIVNIKKDLKNKDKKNPLNINNLNENNNNNKKNSKNKNKENEYFAVSNFHNHKEEFNNYNNHKFNDTISNNESEKIFEAKIDKNKKVNLNIIIPDHNSNGSEKTVHNKITVYNHYFVNDKSMTLNNPKNPNIFNIFGQQKKELEFNKFNNPQYIDDKNFKNYNKTLAFERGGELIVDRQDSNHFSLPESQKRDIKESFMKNKLFRK